MLSPIKDHQDLENLIRSLTIALVAYFMNIATVPMTAILLLCHNLVGVVLLLLLLLLTPYEAR